MAGLGLNLSFNSAPSWKGTSSLLLSSRRTGNGIVKLSVSHLAIEKDFWKYLSANPSEWWDNNLSNWMACRGLSRSAHVVHLTRNAFGLNRSTPHAGFRHRTITGRLRLNNQFNALFVDSQVATLDIQLQGCLQEPWYIGPSRAGDEFGCLCKEGQLDRALDSLFRMDQEGIVPTVSMYRDLLKACAKRKALDQAKRVHAHLASYGLMSTRFLGENVVGTLVQCGGLTDAVQVFQKLSQRTVFSWTAVISGYATAGQGYEALRMYRRMQDDRVQPNTYTFVSLLQACVSVSDLEEGKRIHAEALKYRYDSDLFVCTGLVDMYAKCGSMLDAQIVFDASPQRDVVSWNAMLTAYAQEGQGEKTLQLYEEMREQGVSPNDRTFVSVLQACAILAVKEEDVLHGLPTRVKSLEQGKAIHAEARKKGYDSDSFVGSTLVSMYGKCGSIVDAQDVFNGLPQQDVVAWTAMLTAYVDQGQCEKALELFGHMQEEGVTPNEITLVSILQACSHAGSLDICKYIHQYFVFPDSKSSQLLATTLIHAYGRCASMVDAQNVFDALPKPDHVSWNALIAGYARQGNHSASLQCYEKMRLANMCPNAVTFLSLMSICSHAGLVDEGVDYFESMSRDHGITPEMEHYAAMVDLLARAGQFTRVEDLLASMPFEPDLAMWLCLLGACRKHGKIMVGRKAFDRAIHLQPRHAAAYFLMSNIYLDAGLVGPAQEVNELRETAGVWKKPAQTWIGHDQAVHSFVVGDCKHAQQEQLYITLEQVRMELKGGPLKLMDYIVAGDEVVEREMESLHNEI